jgi:hypothetical protein
MLSTSTNTNLHRGKITKQNSELQVSCCLFIQPPQLPVRKRKTPVSSLHRTISPSTLLSQHLLHSPSNRILQINSFTVAKWKTGDLAFLLVPLGNLSSRSLQPSGIYELHKIRRNELMKEKKEKNQNKTIHSLRGTTIYILLRKM